MKGIAYNPISTIGFPATSVRVDSYIGSEGGNVGPSYLNQESRLIEQSYLDQESEPIGPSYINQQSHLSEVSYLDQESEPIGQSYLLDEFVKRAGFCSICPGTTTPADEGLEWDDGDTILWDDGDVISEE